MVDPSCDFTTLTTTSVILTQPEFPTTKFFPTLDMLISFEILFNASLSVGRLSMPTPRWNSRLSPHCSQHLTFRFSITFETNHSITHFQKLVNSSRLWSCSNQLDSCTTTHLLLPLIGVFLPNAPQPLPRLFYMWFSQATPNRFPWFPELHKFTYRSTSVQPTQGSQPYTTPSMYLMPPSN